MVNDIDLSGAEWVPIGNNSTDLNDSRFTGVFDGQGYIIYNLTVTVQRQYVGLFGYIADSTIKNVGLEGISIDVRQQYYSVYAGGVCGINSGSSIINCYSTGTIVASYSGEYDYWVYAGGICGRILNSGIIRNCYNTSSITVSRSSLRASAIGSFAGGICGNGGIISNCYNTGVISSSFGSYFSSSVPYAGGICGFSGIISNCYNTGVVSASAGGYSAYAGSISGGSYNSSDPGTIIENCYWNIDTVQKVNNIELINESKKGVGQGNDTTTPLTPEQMRTQSSFVGWDFDTVWAINEGVGFPYLRSMSGGGIGDEFGDYDIEEILINRVKKYTSDFDDMDFMEKLNTWDLSDISDYNEMVDIYNDVVSTHKERWDYTTLINNERYSYWEHYKHITKPEIFYTLGFSALFFNDEVWDYAVGIIPEKEKYKTALKKFMEADNEYLRNKFAINDVKFILGSMEKSAQIDGLIAEAELLKNLKNQTIKCDTLEDAKLLLTKHNILKDELMIDKIKELQDLFKLLGNTVKIVEMTADSITDLANVSSQFKIYQCYYDFLEIIRNSPKSPFFLREAARELQADLYEQYLIAIQNIGQKAAQFVLQGVFSLKDISAVFTSEILAGLGVGKLFGNFLFGTKDFIEGSSYVSCYAILSDIYVEILENDKINFKNDLTFENAEKFKDNYNILWSLRKIGEETFYDMTRQKDGWDNTIKNILRSTSKYTENATFAQENIEIIKGIEFKMVDGEPWRPLLKRKIVEGIDYNQPDVIITGAVRNVANNEYSINLSDETFIVPSDYTIQAYSTNGGEKWKKGDLTDKTLAKLLNKEMTLHITDNFNTKTKKPSEDATIVTFAKINERPKLPKLTVNYVIGADKTGETAGQFVLTEKDGTRAVKKDIEIALADASDKNRTPDIMGFGVFYEGETNGISVSYIGTVNGKEKVTKTMYFIRTAPKNNGASYTPASRAKRFSVKSEQKMPNYKINAKKGTIKLKANTFINLNGKATFFANKTEINATGITEIWQGATARKSASAKQFLNR